MPPANCLHTSTREPHEPTTSGLPAHDDPRVIMRRRTSAAGSHLQSFTRNDRQQHARGSCLGTKKPGESTPLTSRWRLRCCHLWRPPSGRIQATTRVARSGADALDLRGERTWKRSMGHGPEPISVRLLVTYCVFESSFPNRRARVFPRASKTDLWPPSMGFGTLRRLQKRAATYTGLA